MSAVCSFCSGRRVHAPDGCLVGRLQDFRAECEHDYYVVTDYYIGPAALIERP